MANQAANNAFRDLLANECALLPWYNKCEGYDCRECHVASNAALTKRYLAIERKEEKRVPRSHKKAEPKEETI
jgi:hypothetical protein